MACDMPQSLKKGTTVADRAVVNAALAVTAAPSVATDQMAPTGMWRQIDLVAKEAGGQICAVLPWWYYADSNTWVAGTALALAANGTAATVFVPNAASGLYVQVSVCPAGGNVSAWLIGRGAVSKG